APTTLSARVTAPRSAAIYTRSLHDALPIYRVFRPLIIDIRPQRNIVGSDREQSLVFLPRTCHLHLESASFDEPTGVAKMPCSHVDRKSPRLNSSHVKISYAVFCLQKKIPCP